MIVRRLNDHGLRHVLGSGGLRVVAFVEYGPPPCRHFKPEYEVVAKMFEGAIRFYEIDAQENPTVAKARAIESVPTTLVFRDCNEIARYEGPYSREFLRERIGPLIA